MTELEAVLDELVHACEDEVDDYPRMAEACEKAKKLLPEYRPREESPA